MTRLSVFLILFSLICFSCRDYTDTAMSRRIVPGKSLFVNSKFGNDNNPGTRIKPVRTIDEVNRRIVTGTAHVHFHGSHTFTGTLLLRNLNGTKKVPVIIDSYGRGRAIIEGGKKEAIKAESCSWMVITHLHIKGDGRKNGNATNGLAVTGCRNIEIDKIETDGFQKSGVDLYNCKHMKVKNVHAHDNGFCGINVMGSSKNLSGRIIIQGCRADNNPGDPTILDNHSGNGILVGVSDSVTIDNCIATNNGWDMPRIGNGPVGIWAWMSNNVKIQYCISFRNKTSKGAKDGGGFDLDGGVTNSVIQYCLSFGNQGAGYGLFQYSGASGWSDNTIRYCFSFNDARTTEGSGSFFIWNGTDDSSQLKNCRIYNNIVFTSSAPAVSFEPASLHQSFTIRNNIFMGPGDLTRGINTGSTFINNLWLGKKGDTEIKVNKSNQKIIEL